jgi:thiol:disulfide interchange protein DsbD
VSGAFEIANDWVGRELASSTGAQTFLYLALGGVLASLLPCVYPLYPITAAILRERESRLGRFAHPTVYYAGLCAMYFAFGLLAALAGGAFNSVLHLPAANLTIGVTMLLLALSTIGLLHFPMFAVGDGQGTGLLPTFVMGLGAGLLSSACVGPIVVSILVQLAAHSGEVSLQATLAAAFKMFTFGMGLGSPLLAIGLFGISLPRSGRWMLSFQWAFGLLIGYFALGYFVKGLLGLGFSESAAQTILAGAAMLLVAAYMRQPVESSAEQRSKAALMTLLGVMGFFAIGRAMLVADASSVSHAAPALAASNTTQGAFEQKGPFKWHLDKAAAYAEAAQSGRPVFVDFHADWCSNCKAFQERTLADQQFRAALQHAVLLKVYDTSALFSRYRDDPRFPELRVGLPFFLITDAKGELLYKTSDFTKTDEMALFLSDS